MTLQALKSKFNKLVRELNNNRRVDMGFSTVVEAGYEALVLAQVMKEYRRIHGPAIRVEPPARGSFLNQKPGQFRTDKAFEITFQKGRSFYFATDIELFGLYCTVDKRPHGMLFEADIVVIPVENIVEVLSTFRGYPAPQHLHAVYECKFGKYNKGQLRELLGLRRHLSALNGNDVATRHPDPTALHEYVCKNAKPSIPIKMVRPRLQKFFDQETANLYDLQQLAIS
jgi:hypothetical protein